MAKRAPMKFKCTCNNETKLKPILLGFQTHCKNCGKEYNKEEVLANVEFQKSEIKKL